MQKPGSKRGKNKSYVNLTKVYFEEFKILRSCFVFLVRNIFNTFRCLCFEYEKNVSVFQFSGFCIQNYFKNYFSVQMFYVRKRFWIF